MKVNEILNEGRKDYVQTFSELDSDELVKHIQDMLKQAEKDAAKLKTASTSVPAGPDTSKFRAAKSGDVRLEKTVTVHGAYNSAVTYEQFLKIGGAIALDQRRKIDAEFLDKLAEYVDDVASENTHIKCDDGMTVSVRIMYGTNWGGIGYKVGK